MDHAIESLDDRRRRVPPRRVGITQGGGTGGEGEPVGSGAHRLGVCEELPVEAG